MTSGTRGIRTFSEDEALVGDRRKQIADGAIRVFIKNGYEKTRMSDIAKACGMSKGLLYHYVSSKTDVLYLIVDDAVQRGKQSFRTMRERFGDLGATDAVRRSIALYYSNVDRLQDYQVFLNQAAHLLPREDRRLLFEAEHDAISYFESILKKGVASGEFDLQDPTVMAHNILILGRTWADRRWFLGRRYTFEEYLDIQTRAILKTIQPQPAANATGSA